MQLKLALAMVCATLFFLFTSTPSLAQTGNSIDIIYIESQQLTPEIYGQLVKQFQQDNIFEIGEACVPAHVFSVKIKEGTTGDIQSLFTAFKSKVSNTSLTQMSLLSDYNDEKFMNRCSAARFGR